MIKFNDLLGAINDLVENNLFKVIVIANKEYIDQKQEVNDKSGKEKHDIFYENGTIKYKVSHLGSTIFCLDERRSIGMGSIQNFSIDKFYAVEKPVVVEPEPVDSSINTQ